jgi:hypothetical protein
MFSTPLIRKYYPHIAVRKLSKMQKHNIGDVIRSIKVRIEKLEQAKTVQGKRGTFQIQNGTGELEGGGRMKLACFDLPALSMDMIGKWVLFESTLGQNGKLVGVKVGPDKYEDSALHINGGSKMTVLEEGAKAEQKEGKPDSVEVKPHDEEDASMKAFRKRVSEAAKKLVICIKEMKSYGSEMGWSEEDINKTGMSVFIELAKQKLI